MFIALGAVVAKKTFVDFGHKTGVLCSELCSQFLEIMPELFSFLQILLLLSKLCLLVLKKTKGRTGWIKTTIHHSVWKCFFYISKHPGFILQLLPKISPPPRETVARTFHSFYQGRVSVTSLPVENWVVKAHRCSGIWSVFYNYFTT